MLPGVFLSLPEHTPLARTWLAQVRREAMRVEIEYHDLEERYRTRELCGVPNDPTEKEAAHALRVTWAALAEETEKVDESLEDVKAKFTEITSTQVKEAATVCVYPYLPLGVHSAFLGEVAEARTNMVRACNRVKCALETGLKRIRCPSAGSVRAARHPEGVYLSLLGLKHTTLACCR